MLGSHFSKLIGVVLNKASPRWYGAFDGGRYLRYATPPAPSGADADADHSPDSRGLHAPSSALNAT